MIYTWFITPCNRSLLVQEVSWQQEFHSNTYSYFGELSNPLDSVKLIQTVRRAIINKKEPEYAYH